MPVGSISFPASTARVPISDPHRNESMTMTAEAGPVPSDPPVTDLVTHARNGEQQAWNELVERYAPLIWSICHRYRLAEADSFREPANPVLRLPPVTEVKGLLLRGF